MKSFMFVLAGLLMAGHLAAQDTTQMTTQMNNADQIAGVWQTEEKDAKMEIVRSNMAAL
jgi:hypothetical protein